MARADAGERQFFGVFGVNVSEPMMPLALLTPEQGGMRTLQCTQFPATHSEWVSRRFQELTSHKLPSHCSSVTSLISGHSPVLAHCPNRGWAQNLLGSDKVEERVAWLGHLPGGGTQFLSEP